MGDKVRASVSWFPFWAAGFMFTLGLVGPHPMLATCPLWQQVIGWLLSWAFWPLILGYHLGGPWAIMGR